MSISLRRVLALTTAQHVLLELLHLQRHLVQLVPGPDLSGGFLKNLKR